MNHKMRTISETLAMLHGGAFADECTTELKDLVRGVEETGKPGKLTITLDIKKAGAAVQIESKVVSKVPETKADPDHFWATVEGNLTLQNPNQRSLDLQDVKAPVTVLAS